MKNIIILLFLAVNSTVYSQNNLSGKVIDSSTNLPVVGATVYIPELERGAITDLDGFFFMDRLSKETIEVVTSSLGYASYTAKVVLPLEENLILYLSPSAIEMEEVIISTPFHQLQSENVVKVERETLKEMSRTGAITLAEGISDIAGVESITTGSGIGKPVIRGLSSNRVLVYTQGVRLENQQFGDEHGLGVSSSGLESVEVIKGPASLLYGSDALGGVLYLNPEKYAPADSLHADAKALYYSNTLGSEFNAGVKKSFDKFKFLARGNYAVHSDYKTGDGERVSNSRFSEADLKVGAGYRDNNYKGDLRYNFNNSTAGIPEGLGSSTSKEVLEPYQELQNQILSLDNTFYLRNSSLDLKLGYLFNDRKEFEDHHHEEEEAHEEPGEIHTEEAALHMKLKTLSYDAKYHFPASGRLETIIGVQGMYQENLNLGEEFLIPDALTMDVGILATAHYHLEMVDLQAGVRFDNRQIRSETMLHEDGELLPRIRRQFNSFNGAFGIKFDLTPKVTARLNLASGFRAPNLAELTSEGSHHGSNRYEIGNAGLENERNYQADLALEWRTDHFEGFANGFYNSLDQYIYLQPTGGIMDDNPVYRYVQADAELYGGEAGIHIHPHPLDWLHLESSFELVIGQQKNGGYLPLTPSPSISNTLRMEFGEGKWLKESYGFLTVKSNLQQNRVNRFEEPTGAYTLLSAGIGGNIGLWGNDLLLQVSGNNLLNKTYFSHLSRLKADGLSNRGRNISISAQIEL